MPWILLAVITVLVLWLTNTGNQMGIDTHREAIRLNIVIPLGLGQEAENALYAHAAFETGNFQSHIFTITHSLFNRHVGNGKIGAPNSDGFWTGKAHYASPLDPNLRTYINEGQSALDFSQWLREGPFHIVLAALREGSPSAYFAALEAVGFAQTNGYAQKVQQKFDTIKT